MNKEHRKRKMAKVRLYIQERSHKLGENIGVFLVIMVIFAVAYTICYAAIGAFTHWLHFGIDDGNQIVSFIAGIILGVWLIANLKYLITFIEWWQEPEEDDVPRTPVTTPRPVTATFTGDVMTGEGHTWLEVPISTMDGGDRIYYVRLHTDSDLCAMVLRKSEGKELRVGGSVFMPDDDERDEYDLLMVVTDVSTVSEQNAKEEVKA